MDGGSGSDEKVRWILARDYQLVVKGYSNVRARLWAEQVGRWDPYGGAWLGEISPPIDWGRDVRLLIKKRLKKNKKDKKDKFTYSYYIFTIQMPSKRQLMNCYDQRGGAEVEQFRHDKSGLALNVRRKPRFHAQQALILLTDLAHNFLAYFHRVALANSTFTHLGPLRIVRDLLTIPGRLTFASGQLKRIDLLDTHPYAKEMLTCLQRLTFLAA